MTLALCMVGAAFGLGVFVMDVIHKWDAKVSNREPDGLSAQEQPAYEAHLKLLKDEGGHANG